MKQLYPELITRYLGRFRERHNIKRRVLGVFHLVEIDLRGASRTSDEQIEWELHSNEFDSELWRAILSLE